MGKEVESTNQEQVGAEAQATDETITWEEPVDEQQPPPPPAEGKKESQQPSQATEPPSTTNGDSLQPRNLQFILDIPLQVTVELGRTKLLIHDLLQLGQGSVIELSKQIGEPFEVLVNQKLIARGEVVVVNDKFGVRITDIISPMERVEQLR